MLRTTRKLHIKLTLNVQKIEKKTIPLFCDEHMFDKVLLKVNADQKLSGTDELQFISVRSRAKMLQPLKASALCHAPEVAGALIACQPQHKRRK